MAIYAIGDTHLSLGSAQKPMDVFRGWENYVDRLAQNWRATVQPEDTVIVAGDVSWAMKLEDCRADFAFLDALPGRKILMKGNHDYWWTTLAKMQRYLATEGFSTLSFLFNNCFFVDGVALCGTRSWFYDIGEAHDEKVMNRERGRLIASLEAAGDAPKIVFLHYPPLSATACAEDIVAVLQQYGVTQCYYGHLHSVSLPHAVQGWVDGIHYRLISADGLDFCPLKIEIESRNI